jgi:uncharacterized protein (DUF1330 family)
MAAYAVAEIAWNEVHGPERYLKLVQTVLKHYGGRYLAFGPVKAMEGREVPLHLAIVEFPSMDAAKRFYESEEYGLARKIRAISAKTEWVGFVDGLTISE